jgi:hypothetical protein
MKRCIQKINDIYISKITNMDPYEDTIQQREMYHENCLMMIQLYRNMQQIQDNKLVLIE